VRVEVLGNLAVDLVQEGHEVGAGVALADVGDDLPGGDLDTAAATGGFMYSATRSRIFSTS
jgi:hypothetical protein